MFRHKPTREELITRLEQLERSTKPIQENMGAMCYSMMYVEPEPHKCPVCGTENPQVAFMSKTLQEIFNIVEEIRKLGYDAQLDVSEFCSKCSAGKEFDAKQPKLVFSIKTAGEADYHRVVSSVVDDYVVLLAFLVGQDTYPGGHGSILNLKRETAVIHKMLGIEPIPPEGEE